MQRPQEEVSESGSRQMTHSSWYEESSSLDDPQGAVPPPFFSSSFDMMVGSVDNGLLIIYRDCLTK